MSLRPRRKTGEAISVLMHGRAELRLPRRFAPRNDKLGAVIVSQSEAITQLYPEIATA